LVVLGVVLAASEGASGIIIRERIGSRASRLQKVRVRFGVLLPSGVIILAVETGTDLQALAVDFPVGASTTDIAGAGLITAIAIFANASVEVSDGTLAGDAIVAIEGVTVIIPTADFVGGEVPNRVTADHILSKVKATDLTGRAVTVRIAALIIRGVNISKKGLEVLAVDICIKLP